MSDLSHRFSEARITVVGSDGLPLTRTPVSVEQVQHGFGFGNIGFDFVEWLGGPPKHPGGRAIEFFGGELPSDAPALAATWLELFNMVTLPFYWRGFEPEQGQTETTRLLATAEWFAARGVEVKGHPLVWHTLTPEWLLQLDDDDAEAAIRDRITNIVTDFSGVINHWDAINEAVILPVFAAEDNAVTRLARRKGRIGMIEMAVSVARDANPGARLVLNDFDLSPSYETLIRECLDAGIEIDAIGLQTHMHQGYRGEDAISQVLERFSKFGLPLQLTETTLLSGDLMPREIVDLNDYIVDSWPSTADGEARQADEIARHYRTVVAHPAVESLTYWGITDAGAWLGAPSGLLRRDGSSKPAYDALHALVRDEWWYPATGHTTDDSGALTVRGFAGTYRVTTGVGSAEVTLGSGQENVVATVRESR